MNQEPKDVVLAFSGGLDTSFCVPYLQERGWRVHTVFAYLDEVGAGGETDFPRVRVRVSPRRGRIVHFTNLLADGTPDEDTLHAGLPVRAGEKWLATIWTRQRPYREY